MSCTFGKESSKFARELETSDTCQWGELDGGGANIETFSVMNEIAKRDVREHNMQCIFRLFVIGL